MLKSIHRLGVGAGAFAFAQILTPVSAHAVPSDQEAWSNIEQKITVYKDAVDKDIYWFIPKIRFETSGGKTLLRPTTLANGKVEYITRIIPYFSKDLREEVAQNISNIRQDSQLKPVVAKRIGIALPDFDYKFSSPSVTNYQYLDVPRLVRFQLDKDEAATFDQLYNDELGVPVEFMIAYDGMMTDKFYNIDISCKEMDRELSTNFKPSASVSAKAGGAQVFLGADLEFAFVNSVQNSTNGVNITSKGDIAGMQEMLNRVMNLCFEPVDSYGSYGGYGNTDYPTRRNSSDHTDDGLPTRRTTPGRGDVIDDGFTPRNQILSSRPDDQEANWLRDIHDRLDLDRNSACDPKDASCDDSPLPTRNPTANDPGLLPAASLKAGYVFKKTALDKDNQAVVKQIDLKDTTSTTTVVYTLTANAKAIEKVNVQPIADQKFTVTSKNPASAPFETGIKINDGEQYTINAEFVFNAASGYASWKPKQYAWDAAWPKTDGDLYYRLGSGDWTPVNRRSIITSDVTRGGGELQFYLDRSAIFNKIPEKLRKGSLFIGPAFTFDGIDPQFVVQVSGRRIEVK
jgi:hypothetical protein